MSKKGAFPQGEINKTVKKSDTSPTTVGETTTIVGNIKSTGQLDIQGRVQGDIETSGDLLISGVVEGNVQGKNVVMSNASLKGNVEALYDVSVRKSVLLGNIKANNVILDSKMKGDIVVQESTEITPNAILVGNINTKEISAKAGAQINGTITTRESNLKDSEFSFDKDQEIKSLDVSGVVMEDDEKEEEF